ncbi:MAG: serine hydrolase, partial [Chloroflexi bacterium]|nr:serine hydrolase [Chloroflexota bacterium]
SGLPPGTRLAHKSGQLEGIRNDAGIVFGPTGPYALAVLTHDLYDPAEGEQIITAVTRVVHRYFTGA